MLWVLIGGNRNRVVCSLLALIWFRQISGSVSAIALRQCWLVTFVAVAFTRSVFFDKFLLNATNIATYWPLHRLDYVIRSCIPQLENITCIKPTRSSAIAKGPRDASCQLKSCQLPRNSAETTCTTSPEPSISCR